MQTFLLEAQHLPKTVPLRDDSWITQHTFWTLLLPNAVPQLYYSKKHKERKSFDIIHIEESLGIHACSFFPSPQILTSLFGL